MRAVEASLESLSIWILLAKAAESLQRSLYVSSHILGSYRQHSVLRLKLMTARGSGSRTGSRKISRQPRDKTISCCDVRRSIDPSSRIKSHTTLMFFEAPKSSRDVNAREVFHFNLRAFKWIEKHFSWCSTCEMLNAVTDYIANFVSIASLCIENLCISRRLVLIFGVNDSRLMHNATDVLFEYLD